MKIEDILLYIALIGYLVLSLKSPTLSSIVDALTIIVLFLMTLRITREHKQKHNIKLCSRRRKNHLNQRINAHVANVGEMKVQSNKVTSPSILHHIRKNLDKEDMIISALLVGYFVWCRKGSFDLFLETDWLALIIAILLIVKIFKKPKSCRIIE